MISVKDIVGRAINATGQKVLWEVWDLVTNTKLNIGGQSTSLDLGVDTTGSFLIGVKLDDSQTLWFKFESRPQVDLTISNGGSDLDNGDSFGAQGSIVQEDKEESVGAFILVNWDDDNQANGTVVPDLQETTVIGEDNLALLTPWVSPLPRSGSVELEVSGADANKVKLWVSQSKLSEITLSSFKKSWNLSDSSQRTDFQNRINGGIWIEGIAPGTAKRAVSFTLRYKELSNTFADDKVNATIVFMRLGSAVYRELNVFMERHLGHGAILYRFKDGVELTEANLENAASYEVCHSMGQANGPTIQPYTNITQEPGAAHWPGCYELPNMSYVDRLNALKAAKELYDLRAAISYPSGFATNVIVTQSGGTNTWNGAFSDIIELRCDGFIEAIFEKPGSYLGNVWGKLDGGVWKYSLSLFAGLHNDQDYGFGFASNFTPATQSGHSTPTGNTATTFVHKSYVAEPGLRN